jgi:hypothetical protein
MRATSVTAGLDELNDVGIDLDPRCGLKDAGKLDGSPKRAPRSTSSSQLVEPRALATAGSRRLPLRDEPLCLVAKSMVPKKRREPAWTTTPSGFPEQ